MRGESFDTKHNVIIQVYPVKALATTTVIMPVSAAADI